MVLHSSASIKSRSRSASCACCTSNSPVFGVVMFTSPFWSPWSAVRWAAVAVAVRLPCMIAADFCAVNRAVFVPQSPFRGDVGKFFCTKFRGVFCANRCGWGDYRGHISLAYPGTIPGAVNTLGGGSGLPGGRSADRRGRRSRRQIGRPAAGGQVGRLRWGRRVGVSVRRSAGRRTAPAVSRTASHPPAPPAGQAQEIPNAQARAEIPCRAGAQAQRQPSTARAASPPPAPPASRPQEIPNARAREDTTTRRPARNSKRARARYWRRGSRPLRVRKPKIFLGKGSKMRQRKKTGRFWAKKKPPMRRLMARTAGGCNMERAGARVCARGYRLRVAQRSAAVKRLAAGIIFVASRKWSEGERDDDAATGNRKAELPTVCWQLRYYSFCSKSPVSHSRETPRTRAKMASS